VQLTKETLGLAGEYAVASELCRRRAYCQLTLGNRKRIDLLVEAEDSLFRVSVKTKQKQDWPHVKGIYKKDELLVFVDYKGKELEEPPDFYVLDVLSWKKVVRSIKKLKSDPNAIINSENTLVWPAGDGRPEWKGCRVRVADVAAYKNEWPQFAPPVDLAGDA